MTKNELKQKLSGKTLIFVNRLVKSLGGSKKGSKSQDIEEILGFYDADADRVVSMLQTMELTQANKFAKLKEFFGNAREHWETLADHISKDENLPDGVQKAFEFIDGIIDFIFPQK